MSTLQHQALQILKKKSKSLGLTQAQIAKNLNVSLPTVKRWWAGQSLTIPILEHLCNLMGLSISNLFLEAESGSASYTYTAEQEQMFLKHPKVLALFDLLVSGETAQSVQKKYSLQTDEIFAMLVKLDRVGLIELHPNNKVKLLRMGEPQWIPGGVLSAKYRLKMIESLLADHEKSQTTFFIHNYNPEDVMQIKAKLQELREMLLSYNTKGNINKDRSHSYGVYYTLKEFEWDLRSLLKK